MTLGQLLAGFVVVLVVLFGIWFLIDPDPNHSKDEDGKKGK